MSKLNTRVNKLEEKTDSFIESSVFSITPAGKKLKGKILSKGHALSLWYEIYSQSRSSWKFVGCKTVLVCH